MMAFGQDEPGQFQHFPAEFHCLGSRYPVEWKAVFLESGQGVFRFLAEFLRTVEFPWKDDSQF